MTTDPDCASILSAKVADITFGSPDTSGIDRDELYYRGQRIPCPGPSDDPPPPSSSVPTWLSRASALLRQDQVVAFPTETVYGLAGNALSASAVRRIFAAKNRPADNPLIVHISSLAMLRTLLPDGRIPSVYEPLIRKYWPGPLTLLMPTSDLIIPSVITCGQPTVAIRFPAHPIARALIAYSGLPLAAPSANSSGKPSPTLAQHVWTDLRQRIPLIVDGGQCDWGIESTVVDGLRLGQPTPVVPAILRPGGVTLEQIQQVPGFEQCQVYRKNFTDHRLEAAPTTPGMKYRHYSPRAQVILFEARPLNTSTTTDPSSPASIAQPKGLVGDPADDYATAHHQTAQHPSPTSQPSSKHLFRSFRDFDDLGVDYILVEGTSERDEGLAVMNRLHKAASRTVYY
ncbi:DHBP synthase RibB-like alpha/beta domain-containing protein [Dimargaris cristalligena]|uniref:Threonylcarbamoyl-AMP synthase n=1 Tax=Dimargaris cristalligena TaxID=215637 RepID=A0A4P9ZPF9_9FUNG|nr:DHBP synthase RibB-like alpha/beta domain-containing protein [Dimargaris cristalligena]|eukprot:RKP35326.1 DHBP synthase RibB-like alpha/beta domain-containing protein [Dimargaris cristalligena]